MVLPKYKAIASFIAERIDSGEWQEGHPVPSESELAARFAASRMTARKAVDTLVAEQKVTRIAGVGSFVNSPIYRGSLLQIHNIADEIRHRGHQHSAKLISRMRLFPNPNLSAALAADGGTLFKVVILHFEDGRPIQLEERFVNAEHFPDFLQQDFSRITTHAYLSSLAPLTESQLTLEAINPSATLKDTLAIQDDSPCLKLTRHTRSRGVPVSIAILYYPADRYRLTSSFPVTKEGS
ncbi:UTRA domain-containing protein [Bowmanella sp. Y26]|uniref:UTRA domain-containing protein n=1 Tax=Bowmanella yangjiangensis TaxID=2811230 RepID=UPI001BDC447A|nr:UTRA domain-containing protein [Bowmanella yangjiangensis]MBT1063313.1 UTRA domain-containing protein [Bowmanella yangjiangensis]